MVWKLKKKMFLYCKSQIRKNNIKNISIINSDIKKTKLKKK